MYIFTLHMEGVMASVGIDFSSLLEGGFITEYGIRISIRH